VRELWKEHKKDLFPALAVLCFFAAGLTAWAFREREREHEREQPLPNAPAAEKRNPAPERRERQKKPASAPAPAFRVEPETESEEDKDKTPEKTRFVYITGSIRNPGVYGLPPDARIFHLVQEAGGFLDGFADPTAVNLAAPVEDGMHIHIPSRAERQRPTPAAPRAPNRKNASAGPIDVNRATAEELTALKGIGPALAKNIVEFRQRNGRFRSVEDLLQVKGIGPKTLENFRDHVTTGP
jgi:competence protein ComEA